MNKLIEKAGKIVAAGAKQVTSYSVNRCCVFSAHQPKLPQDALKLRKF